MSRRT